MKMSKTIKQQIDEEIARIHKDMELEIASVIDQAHERIEELKQDMRFYGDV